MSLDLKRQLVAQLVESSRLLPQLHRSPRQGPWAPRARSGCTVSIAAAGGLSQVDLADMLEPATDLAGRLLDRLVEHGLLERRPDPRDRRANRLFLTPGRPPAGDDLDSLRDSIVPTFCKIFRRGNRNRPRDAPAHQGADQEFRRTSWQRRRPKKSQLFEIRETFARATASRAPFSNSIAMRLGLTGLKVVHITARIRNRKNSSGVHDG